MPKLTIQDMPPLDGVYDLDLSRFSGDELHLIKKVSGVRAGELEEALGAGDYDLVVAFATIALRRAGKTVQPEQISAADAGGITVELDEEVEQERPPASAPPNGNENEHGGSGGGNGNTGSSGSAGTNDGDEPVNVPSRTGSRGSETFATSAPRTSEN